MQNVIGCAAKGKRAAFTELYESNWKEAKFICSCLCADGKAADEAVVQAFAKTWQMLLDGGVSSEEEFRDNLLEQAAIFCRKRRGKKGARTLPLPPNQNFIVSESSFAPADGAKGTLEEVLDALPLAGRFVFVLHRIAGFERETIARLTGLNGRIVGLAMEAEEQNLSCMLAGMSKKSGDSSFKQSDVFSEAVRESIQNAELPEKKRDEITKTIDSLIEPIAKKNKKKILMFAIPSAAVVVIALLIVVVAGGVGRGDSDIVGDTESMETAQGGQDVHATSYADIVIEDYGTITIALDADSAPQTVENFISLAQSGFYDGLTFHRIMEGFMMQGGDPNGDGTGGSETTIPGEFSANGYDNTLTHTRGAVSMARSSDYNSASSQFFIVHEDSTFLDGQYAVFGYVTSGMDVVDAICGDAQPVDDNGTIVAEDQPVITSVQIRDVK